MCPHQREKIDNRTKPGNDSDIGISERYLKITMTSTLKNLKEQVDIIHEQK